MNQAILAKPCILLIEDNQHARKMVVCLSEQRFRWNVEDGIKGRPWPCREPGPDPAGSDAPQGDCSPFLQRLRREMNAAAGVPILMSRPWAKPTDKVSGSIRADDYLTNL